MREEILAGGNVTAGVVRVGETVRRPRQPSSRFVRRLLLALEEHGFEGAPRQLGADAQGRDVLSYIPGEVEPGWRRFDDEQVVAGARLLRSFHDLTRTLDLRGSEEVVCHGDPGPHNCVFRDGLPIALVDFDLAAPGPALADVSYAAWAWCVSSNPARGPVAEQARQLRLLADAYWLDQRQSLVDGIRERQAWSARWWQERRAQGLPPAEERSAELVAWNLCERAYVQENRALFLEALA